MKGRREIFWRLHWPTMFGKRQLKTSNDKEAEKCGMKDEF